MGGGDFPSNRKRSRTTMNTKLQIPKGYEDDMRRAIAILKEAGCTHIFLFGSLTSGKVRPGSDIDLAVRGCPKGKFFRVYGRLLREINHPVDLVSLDKQEPFARHLEKQERLIRIV